MRVLNLGAGVQSTTVLLKSLRGEFPPIDHAIFADTGYEPRYTLECVERLKVECEKFGVPLHIVRRDPENAWQAFRDQIPVFVLGKDGSRGMARRQCTKDYKVEPIRAKIREILGVKPGARVPKGIMVQQVFGIGWDETHRMKTPESKWTVNEYPLVDIRWGRRECSYWLKENWPHEVARSACWNCPFRTTHEWLHLHDNDYESWVKAVVFDQDLRDNPLNGVDGKAYIHKSFVPLGEADIRTSEEKGQPSLFGGECEGMCGV